MNPATAKVIADTMRLREAMWRSRSMEDRLERKLRTLTPRGLARVYAGTVRLGAEAELAGRSRMAAAFLRLRNRVGAQLSKVTAQ